jgi:hypothetical protein
MTLRASEWIVLSYCTYLVILALTTRLASDRRLRIVATAAVIVASVLGFALGPTARWDQAARDWMPLIYIVLAYWLPALFVTHTNPAIERALLALDHRWFGRDGLATMAARAPVALIELLELAYLSCYPMVPAGLACLYLAGPISADEADRFWTAVFVAALPCYALLPWLPTRPPRALGFEANAVRPRRGIRRLNLWVLGRASTELNTFPSGHAAASLATALAVGAELPWAGVVLGLIALGISVGSVIGRYHYAADAATGCALAIAGFAISRFV